MTSITIDTRDLRRLQMRFQALPSEVKQRVLTQAMGRVKDMALTRLKRRVSEKINLQQKHIRNFIVAGYDAENIRIRVKEGWMPLRQMDPSQTRKGVAVRFPNGRANYRSAFLADMKSPGVFRRTGSERGPVESLYGPNPANAINNDPELFESFLVDLIEDRMADRVLHEIMRFIR